MSALWGLKKVNRDISEVFFLTLQVIFFLMSPKTSLFCQKMTEKNKVKDANPPHKTEKSMKFVHVYTFDNFASSMVLSLLSHPRT